MSSSRQGNMYMWTSTYETFIRTEVRKYGSTEVRKYFVRSFRKYESTMEVRSTTNSYKWSNEIK